MNFCYREKKQEFIRHNFMQLMKQPTHICGGHIYQFYIRDNSFQYDVDVSLYSPCYVAKDHDAVSTVVYKKRENRMVGIK